MRFILFLFLSSVVGLTALAQNGDESAKPAGTGRVGSAGEPEVSSEPCVPDTKVFSIEDVDSSYKMITYTHGLLRISSGKNENFEVLCGAGEGAHNSAHGGIFRQELKPGFWDWVASDSKLAATPEVKFAHYNTTELPVESIVNTYSANSTTDQDKRIDRVELNYRPWNGKRILLQCSKDPKVEWKIAVLDGKGRTTAVHSFNPNKKGISTKCAPAFYSLSVGKGQIRSSAHPVKVPDSMFFSAPSSKPEATR